MLGAEEWEAVRLSLLVAGRAVAISLPPAVMVAWVLARGRFPGRTLLDALVHLPLVVPPVVVGWALLMLFGLRGPIGSLLESWLGWRMVFSTSGAALATAVMGFPLIVRAVRLGFEGVDQGLEQAAASLGASPLDRFLTVSLPLAMPGVLAGAVTGLAAGLGEFGAVITFAGNIPGETQTLPLAIYSATQTPGGEAAAARLALISFALAVLLLLLAEWLARGLSRRQGRGLMLSVSLAHRFRGGFSLEAGFEAEGITVLFGPSGCGKSTILGAVAGLFRPDAGNVSLHGETWMDGRRWLPPHRRRAGVVFQEARLFPHLSVLGNLRYGAARAPRGTGGPAEAEVLGLLGLEHLTARSPAQLSGGERQRVALARALLSRPRILLMDEPLAALDAPRRVGAMGLIQDIHARFALPILYVTHALDEVDRLATRLVLMGEGNVLASGTPEALALRADLPLARRRDAGVLLNCRVLGHDAARDTTRLDLAGEAIEVPRRDEAPGAVLRLRLRARDVAICLDDSPLPLGHASLAVRVLGVAHPLAGEALVTLGQGELRLLARLPLAEAAGLAEGQPVRALVPRTAFDHRGPA